MIVAEKCMFIIQVVGQFVYLQANLEAYLFPTMRLFNN